MRLRNRPTGRTITTGPEWFTLRPSSLALAVVYLLVLLTRPLFVETEFHAGTVFVITTVIAMLAAWLVWRLCRHSDRLANTAFCIIIAAGAVWTTVLTEPQRVATTDALRAAVQTNAAKVDALAERMSASSVSTVAGRR